MIAREDVPGNKRLVAYVVVAAERAIEAGAAGASGAEPSGLHGAGGVCGVCRSLPLTPNGKLDRRALPAPDLTPVVRRAPRTPQEDILCALFAETLGLERVGIDDNFFALGGDSIVSIQLVSRVRGAGLAITPRDVFQHPSVAGLAAVAKPVAASAPALPDIAVGALPATPIMRWLLDCGGPIDRFNQSTVLELPAGVEHAHLTEALQCVLDHHDALRLRLVAGVPNGDWELEVAPAGSVRAADCIHRIDMCGVGDEGWRGQHRRPDACR